MNLAIIGSRDFNNYDYLQEKINYLIKENNWKIDLIISGGAKGADTLGWIFAKASNIKIVEYKPDWNLGRAAAMIRNTTIIENSDIVIAFQKNKSKGTQDSINKANKLGKIVFVFDVTSI